MDTPHPLAVWRKAQTKPLTQAQLAEMLGVGVRMIKNLENGRRCPSLALLSRIERVTGGAIGVSAFVDEPELESAA